MKKRFIFLITLILLLNYSKLLSSSNNLEIKFKDKPSLNLEIANSEKERKIGLMYRKSLDKYSGMFFDYNELSEVKIWMKNTIIPLDIIFLEGSKIVHIVQNALPCMEFNTNCPKFSAGQPVDSVIEVNSGIVKEYNLKIGDLLFIEK